jgi:hypothetical protein
MSQPKSPPAINLENDVVRMPAGLNPSGQGRHRSATLRPAAASLRNAHETRLVRVRKLKTVSRRSGSSIPKCHPANLMPELAFEVRSSVACEQ